MKNKLTYISTFLLLVPLTLFGQNKELSQEITTVGNWIPTINKAYKINDIPQALDSIFPEPKLTYSIQPKPVNIEYTPDTITPAKLKILEPLSKLYKGYLKTGIGTNTTPLGELYYSNLRSKKGNYTVHAKHFSSEGNIPDAAYSAFSNNTVKVSGEKFIKKHSVNGTLLFDQNVNHFYGFNPTEIIIPNSDSIRQRFNLLGGKAGISSFFKDSSKVNYKGNLSYHNYSDLYESTENNIQLNGFFNRYQNNEFYDLQTIIDFNSYDANLLDTNIADKNQTSTIIGLVPRISTKGKNWKLKLGLGIFGNIDDQNTYHFYPDVEAHYSLFKNIFIPYAGANGSVNRNSYKSLSYENPFILQQVPLQNTKSLNFYGGIRGTISSTTAFNLRFTQESSQTKALFVTDTLYSNFNRFNVIYDNIDISTISAELTYNQKKKFKIYSKGEYFIYNQKNELKPWNLPNFKLTVSGIYDLQDKILARLDAFVVGSRPAFSQGAIAGIIPVNGIYVQNLKSFVDLNLGLEYRYTKKLSAFVNFYNLTSSRFQNWLNYNQQRFNVMGGITYSF